MRSIERSPGKPGDFCARRAPGQVFDRTRGQGTSVILAETCQPGNSTPRFLSAKRSAVSSRREEIAILRWRVNTQGSADPCAIPGGLVLYCLTGRASSTVFASTLFLDCSCKLVCSSYNDQTAEQQIWQSSPPQGIFALQKSLRGDCGGDGVPAAVGNSSPRAKKFPEEICFAPRRVLQICRAPDYLVLKST